MIIQLQQTEDLARFSDTPCGCRIRAAADAYGMDEPFAMFWGQEGKAVICKLDDTLICETLPGVDFVELARFVQAVGARTLLCSAVTAAALCLPITRHGQILRLPAPPESCGFIFEEEPPLREVHALLERCRTATFAPPEFEPFYMDMSHRIRHGHAIALAVRKNGELAAAGMCAAATKGAAVISGVCTAKEHRGAGLGSALVCELSRRLAPREIYVFRAAEETTLFYSKLGFVRHSQWAEIDF